MRRTKDLQVGLLATIAAATLAMSGCSRGMAQRRCYDQNSNVVADRLCQDQDRRGPVSTGGYYPYRWSSGSSSIRSSGSHGSVHAPSSGSSTPSSGGTVHGVFGGSHSSSGS